MAEVTESTDSGDASCLGISEPADGKEVPQRFLHQLLQQLLQQQESLPEKLTPGQTARGGGAVPGFTPQSFPGVSVNASSWPSSCTSPSLLAAKSAREEIGSAKTVDSTANAVTASTSSVGAVGSAGNSLKRECDALNLSAGGGGLPTCHLLLGGDAGDDLHLQGVQGVDPSPRESSALLDSYGVILQQLAAAVEAGGGEQPRPVVAAAALGRLVSALWNSIGRGEFATLHGEQQAGVAQLILCLDTLVALSPPDFDGGAEALGGGFCSRLASLLPALHLFLQNDPAVSCSIFCQCTAGAGVRAAGLLPEALRSDADEPLLCGEGAARQLLALSLEQVLRLPRGLRLQLLQLLLQQDAQTLRQPDRKRQRALLLQLLNKLRGLHRIGQNVLRLCASLTGTQQPPRESSHLVLLSREQLASLTRLSLELMESPAASLPLRGGAAVHFGSLLSQGSSLSSGGRAPSRPALQKCRSLEVPSRGGDFLLEGEEPAPPSQAFHLRTFRSTDFSDLPAAATAAQWRVECIPTSASAAASSTAAAGSAGGTSSCEEPWGFLQRSFSGSTITPQVSSQTHSPLHSPASLSSSDQQQPHAAAAFAHAGGAVGKKLRSLLSAGVWDPQQQQQPHPGGCCAPPALVPSASAAAAPSGGVCFSLRRSGTGSSSCSNGSNASGQSATGAASLSHCVNLNNATSAGAAVCTGGPKAFSALDAPDSLLGDFCGLAAPDLASTEGAAFLEGSEAALDLTAAASSGGGAFRGNSLLAPLSSGSQQQASFCQGADLQRLAAFCSAAGTSAEAASAAGGSGAVGGEPPQSANRKYREMRPACCYFMLGKCEFSRSCVFWHPPPEADPALVVCKYGRACNARHGALVPYPELSLVVHSFVRSHPLLADGEAGRLFHYLRVSKGQEGAAAASASFRLSGKAQQQQEPLVLPDYIVQRFYSILDRVLGRDLSAVNTVWRRHFGESFPYQEFGFDKLRQAIATIPGVHLMTRGSNVIIDHCSKPTKARNALPGTAVSPSVAALSAGGSGAALLGEVKAAAAPAAKTGPSSEAKHLQPLIHPLPPKAACAAALPTSAALEASRGVTNASSCAGGSLAGACLSNPSPSQNSETTATPGAAAAASGRSRALTTASKCPMLLKLPPEAVLTTPSAGGAAPSWQFCRCCGFLLFKPLTHPVCGHTLCADCFILVSSSLLDPDVHSQASAAAAAAAATLVGASAASPDGSWSQWWGHGAWLRMYTLQLVQILRAPDALPSACRRPEAFCCCPVCSFAAAANASSAAAATGEAKGEVPHPLRICHVGRLLADASSSPGGAPSQLQSKTEKLEGEERETASPGPSAASAATTVSASGGRETPGAAAVSLAEALGSLRVKCCASGGICPVGGAALSSSDGGETQPAAAAAPESLGLASAGCRLSWKLWQSQRQRLAQQYGLALHGSSLCDWEGDYRDYESHLATCPRFASHADQLQQQPAPPQHQQPQGETPGDAATQAATEGDSQATEQAKANSNSNSDLNSNLSLNLNSPAPCTPSGASPGEEVFAARARSAEEGAAAASTSAEATATALCL